MTRHGSSGRHSRRSPVWIGWMMLGVLAAGGASIQALEVGETLGATVLGQRLESPRGDTVELEALVAPQGLMLIFASNTCPYMLDWLDRFPRLAAFAEEHGVGFVLVNANARKRRSDDSPEAMTALADGEGWGFPYLIDPQAALADALAAQRTPEVYLFDGARRLVYRGAIDDHSGPWDRVESHWALESLRQMVAGDPLVTPSTPALGCAVQRPRRRRTPPPESVQKPPEDGVQDLEIEGSGWPRTQGEG